MTQNYMSGFQNFLFSVLASLIASVVVLLIERQRLPDLLIKTDNSANVTPVFASGYLQTGKWKFIRATVLNRPMPFILRWLVRQTAENCRATVTVFNSANEQLFSMKGRWTNTPELVYLQPQEQWLKLSVPDPVNIFVGKDEILDIAVMKEGEVTAFGWNNEAYINNWRTPGYKIPEGKYKVKVDVTTQNGVSFSKTANLIIGKNIETSYLEEEVGIYAP